MPSSLSVPRIHTLKPELPGGLDIRSKEVTQFKRGHCGGALTQKDSRPTHQGQATGGHSKQVAVCSREERSTRTCTLPDPDLGLSTLQGCEKINLCCVSHPVCGVLLAKPERRSARETFACNLKKMASDNPYLSIMLIFHLYYTGLPQAWYLFC